MRNHTGHTAKAPQWCVRDRDHLSGRLGPYHDILQTAKGPLLTLQSPMHRIWQRFLHNITGGITNKVLPAGCCDNLSATTCPIATTEGPYR